MNANTSNHEISDMLADYLNGHLDAKDNARVEQALADSSSLRQQLAFQQRLQTALRDESAVADTKARSPQFSQIAHRLEPSRERSLWTQLSDLLGLNDDSNWVRGGLPVAALACLVVTLALTGSGDFFEGPSSIQEFETATATNESFDQPTLRIITTQGISAEDLAALLEDNGLRADRYYPQGSTLDATLLNMSSDIKQVAESLQSDPRVRIVKVVSE